MKRKLMRIVTPIGVVVLALVLWGMYLEDIVRRRFLFTR